MKPGSKRFSISVTEELSKRLRETWEKYYPHQSTKEMLTDLIKIGLAVIDEKKEEE